MTTRTVLPIPGLRSTTAAWTLLIAYIAAIAAASSLPAAMMPAWIRHHDAVVHAVGYSGLGLLVFIAALRTAPTLPRVQLVALAALAVANLALLDELYQSLQAGRQTALSDVIIDVTSATAVMVVAAQLRRRR